MTNLPYRIPDRELGLNLALMLMILKYLGKSKRGKLLVNNDKAQAFLYLIKNPVYLNRVLQLFNQPMVELSYTESFSITSISPDLDPLFDRSTLKALLVILSSKKLIEIKYRNKDGFFYYLSEAGEQIASDLHGSYFDAILKYIRCLEKVQAESATKLNNAINTVLKSRE